METIEIIDVQQIRVLRPITDCSSDIPDYCIEGTTHQVCIVSPIDNLERQTLLLFDSEEKNIIATDYKDMVQFVFNEEIFLDQIQVGKRFNVKRISIEDREPVAALTNISFRKVE